MWNVVIANHGSLVAAMSCERLNGRSVRDGYLRGCGIQFGNIRKLWAADSVFARVHSLARSRSCAIPGDNLCNLFLLITFFLPSIPPGHIVEFGTDRGESALDHIGRRKNRTHARLFIDCSRWRPHHPLFMLAATSSYRRRRYSLVVFFC